MPGLSLNYLPTEKLFIVPCRIAIFLLSLLLLNTFPCFSQKEAQTWYFGKNAGLDFSTSPPTALTNGQINTREGVSSISDKNTGQLLFYSEGTIVWNRNHAIMPNGSGLLGDYSSTQSSVAVPDPGNANKYYLFTTALAKGVRYSVIDMTLQGGLGDVMTASKNTLLIPATSSSEKLIAVQHCNKKDYWVITHTINSNTFYVYLVTAAGVQAPATYSIGYSIGDAAAWEAVGYLKASPDGAKLAHVIGPAYTGATSTVEVMSFNNQTGVLAGPVTSLNNLLFPYGTEFSQSGRYLYISTLQGGQSIYQYDLTAPAVNTTRYVVTTSPNLLFGALQLGPDNKIYVAAENGYNVGYGFLSVINNPDMGGAACGYVQDAISLNGKSTLVGLPTFNATFLKKDTSQVSVSGNCSGSSTVFGLTNTNNVISVKWDFDDGATSTSLTPAHTYSTAGNYKVEVILYRSCNVNDTIKKSVTINTCAITCNNWLKTTNQLDAVKVGDLDIPGNQLTIEGSFNRIAPWSGSYLYAGDIVSKHRDPVDCNYLLRPDHAEVTTANGFFTTPAICDIELNKTYHVAMVYDGNTLKFYRNGFLMSQVAATGSLIQNNWLTTIGDAAVTPPVNPENMNGFINEVRIWNVARSQADIRQYMNTSLPSPTTQTGLLAYYTFYDLLNKQGNPAWNGTLMGNALINQSNTACNFTADSCKVVTPTVVIPSFTAPDTVCINDPININNTTVGATNYYWNFCVADINKAPVGTNLGNPGGNLTTPVFMDYAFYNGNYYGFVVNFNPGSLVRLDFGNSLLNTPTSVNLGNFGGILPVTNSAEGLRVVQNEGRWYVIMVGGYSGGPAPRVLKIDFGANLANPSPVATDWGNLGNMDQPIDFDIFKDDNNNWFGFTINANNNTITRFNFTKSFNNTPTAINLGNVGNLEYPTGIYIANDNGNYRVFITNAGNTTRSSGNFSLSRLDFGTSLLNTPSGINLGNPGNLLQHPRDFTIMKSCGQTIGFAVNGHISNRDIIKLDFNGDLSTVPTATSLGNIGNLSFAHSISRLFRINEDIYSFVTNVDNSTITRLRFTGCNNASLPNSTAQNPPAIKYNTPGTYNINLTIDDGLPTQNATCRQVVVVAAPVAAVTQKILCSGNTIRIGAGTQYAKYTWNTGAVTDSIDVSSPGKYWVQINRFGCSATDTIVVTGSSCIVNASFTAPDTICVNNTVTVTNTSVGATNYYWNFCTGNLNNAPVGTNLGNINNAMAGPVYIDYVLENGKYYGFVSDNHSGNLYRLDFGNSLLNTPALTNLGRLGVIPAIGSEGLQIVKNEGKWYVILVGGDLSFNVSPFIIKIELGTDITNPNPVATNWGNLGNMLYPHKLYVFSDAGNHWYGLTVNTNNSTITRFDFTNSFSNTPTATNLGNIGNLGGPTGIYAINENGNWYAFVTNAINSTITRLDFGNSLLNTPTGQNLGNPGNIFQTKPWDIQLIRFCGQLLGFVIDASNGNLIKLDFNNNILNNNPTAVSFGNIGNMSFPHCLSKIFRAGADLYTFVMNVDNSSLTRIQFAGCTNASIPNSTAENPPPIKYNTPGTYNINLTVDDGLPTQNIYCKQVVVMPVPVHSPTQQRKVCTAKTMRIGTGTKNVTYLWNTGATTDSIDVTAAGTYWVEMDGLGCKVADTFVVRSSACDAPTLSNVINDYTEVLAYNQCDNSLLVNNAGAYKIGDTVLLIQMKGAVIDSSNTSAFGTIKDYRNAGNYEFNYIAGKNGNTLLLKNVLLRTYNIPDGKVQLVRVPYYQSAIITSTLTSLPWDGGKGGVLAFNVKDTLELEADMDVSANGFRRALPLNSTLVTCNETGWYYDASTNQGAQKGEGIYNIGAARNYGRGAPSNGGGGGNGHNAGGGGGANAGAGGEGGNQWEGCATITELVGGKGGNPLQNSALLNKLYAGGSGGMGEGNDHAEFPSGSGGGIIVLTAGAFISNGHIIKANGENAAPCPSGACGDGMSGGGAGGSVVLGITNAIDLVNIEAKGGNGADHVSINNYRHGPGGGGGGGFVAITQSVAPPLYHFNTTGGKNGVNTNFGNDPRGAKAGGNGSTINAFNIAVSSVPFVRNIDSVRLDIDTLSCSTFNFKGMGYTKVSPIQSWLWTFGDGQTATTQNTFHEYITRGSFPVKLTGTDINGCKDSTTTTLTITSFIFDFSYKQDLCNPLSVQFFNVGNNTKDPYWSTGDGNTITGILNPTHTYTAFGDYTVKFSIHEGACIDTVTKVISINVVKDDIIITPDTVICDGATKQLRTKPSLSFCWTPTTYLNDPNSPNPITNTPQNITYYFNAEVPGNNLIVNGDFSAGNTGFTSQYAFALPNTTEGQYAVGPNPQLWNGAASNCRDHTSGNGNMLLVNGNPIANEKVWTQTINVIPNSNYAFSTWIQSISEANPAQLQFSINGKDMAGAITATLPGCNWQQFYTTWNSGNNTTATIAIVNKNTIRNGNDFALDDISFAPVLIKRDSVVITVEKPVVKTNKDTTVCAFRPVPLNTTGAAQYTWTPQAGLSNPSIANPIVNPATSTTYVVTGTTIHGCVAKDTVAVSLFAKPPITKTADTAVCRNSSLPLFVSGGQSYSWSPAVGLSNPAIPGPVASLGTTDVTYVVKITDNHSCDYMDSVKIAIRPYPVFRATGNKAICFGSPTTLQASGGDSYQWTPANLLNDPNAQAPVTSPEVTTQYSVHIAESTCHFDTTINMTIKVNPIPQLVVQKANDINCNTPSTQLRASGALQYAWSPSTGLDNPNIANPVSTADSSVVYLLEGTNQFGCTATKEVPVAVTKDGLPRFVVPNAFTPNGDGNNDCFGIKRWGNARIQEFSVFNRWGQLVFKTNTPAQCWDGTFNGKPQDTGGYVYIIKATTLCGEITRKGIVMLIR